MPPMIATMYLPALNYIRDDLNTTDTILALTVSLYTLVVGMLTLRLQYGYTLTGYPGFMPLIWGPVSDRYGRKLVLLISLTLCAITSLLCGCGILFLCA